MAAAAGTRAILLSVQPASRSQRRLAFTVLLLLLIGFGATLPFAWIEGPPVPNLIAILHTILAINDLITAVLLFGQYAVARPRGLNILAGGYLFTALMSVSYLLSFPGAVSGPALIYGDRSAPWLYVVWHAGLSLAIIVYASLPVRLDARDQASNVRATIARTTLTAAGAAAVITCFMTLGNDWLPRTGTGRQYNAVALAAIDALIVLSLVALLLLARRRPYKILDLWLSVVMFAWLCSVTLGNAIGTIRYDIGYDVSRIFAMLASTFILIMLLTQISALYVQAISERERRLNEMEAILVHMSRVSELGQNVSALVHEVSQPLTAINNYAAASILLMKSSQPARLMPILQQLAEQAERAADIVRHLREFIARQKSERRAVAIPGLLRDAIRLALAGSSEHPPVIEMRFSSVAPSAIVDRVQIEQVIFNLVRNAIEAMTDGPRRLLTIGTKLTRDNMVEISIGDTGPGLPAEIRTKLFEPFVTTKAGGLGVGLSICRVIIEAHGGQLQAEDNTGGGTVFRFTLPLSDEAKLVARKEPASC
jgi:signal transduction histidine kinase